MPSLDSLVIVIGLVVVSGETASQVAPASVEYS